MVEAGWHVRAPVRRQGYAAEAADAVRLAAGEAGVEHLIAIIRPENVASQRVATKTGLVLEREVYKDGGLALVFGADLIHRKSTDEQEDAADTYHGAPDRP
ncbi:MAG TPA: GNAT family N-acetyltransferase [Kribbella sp.]|jgi:RimJ/RimL family protein N-acetyltransferase